MPSTSIIIAKDIFGQHRNRDLVAELISKQNIPAKEGEIPVDVMWTVNDVMVLGDLKKPSDLIASVKDGRLHEQTSHMRGNYGFILLEADGISDDGGHMIGNTEHAWTWEQFDGLLQSLQEEGIKIVRSASEAHTARRLAYLYRRLDEGHRGSWHRPIAEVPPAINFLDSEYREKVGFLMHVGRRLGGSKSAKGMGQVAAEKLIQEYGLMDTLGITEEGLTAAEQRWKAVKGIGPTMISNWKKWLNG